MAPRRGGSDSFGDSSDSGSSGYTVTACSQTGAAWWGLSNVITSAIFLAVYLIISIWHLVFMVKSKQIKGVPMLLRFRFGACLFCFFLSSFLETIYIGAHECGDMEFYDYITGMIPARIFLHVAWLFLVFVVLFPMSRVIRVTRRMLMPPQGENKSKQHSNKNIERTIQAILLILMIVAVTIHLFIHALNQVEVRRYPPYDRQPGEVESYAAFPFLQMLSNVILLGVSRSRMSAFGNLIDLRLVRIKSRHNIFLTILLLRSLFMIIDTIVFDLVRTQSLLGLFLMSLIQKCLDALLLVYVLLLTKSVRMLGNSETAPNNTSLAPAAQKQTIIPANGNLLTAPAYPYPHPQSPQQPTNNGSSTGQSMPPASGIYPSQVYPYSVPSPQLGQMHSQAQPLPQGQWIFVPHEQVSSVRK